MELRFCDECGSRIDGDSSAGGNAVVVGNMVFCPACVKAGKADNVQQNVGPTPDAVSAVGDTEAIDPAQAALGGAISSRPRRATTGKVAASEGPKKRYTTRMRSRERRGSGSLGSKSSSNRWVVCLLLLAVGVVLGYSGMMLINGVSGSSSSSAGNGTDGQKQNTGKKKPVPQPESGSPLTKPATEGAKTEANTSSSSE
jgi:hypothetical protein